MHQRFASRPRQQYRGSLPRSLRHGHAPGQGFSLIETLVSLFIVSLGILGLAMLQFKSLQYSHSGMQRSLATIQATDAVERMWANICDMPDALPDVLSAWQATYQGSLAGWSGDIVQGTNYVITVSWTDPRMDGGADSFVYRTNLPTVDCS